MRRFFGLLLTVFIFAAGCSSSPDDSGQTGAAESPPEQPDKTEKPGQDKSGTRAPDVDPASEAAKLLDFEAENPLTGENVDMATFLGKNLAIWFWEPWCPTCNEEAPGVVETMNEVGDDVTFVGYVGDAGGDAGTIPDFLEEHNVPEITQISGRDGWARFGVAFQPAWIFIDESGEVTRYNGPLGADGLAEQISDNFSKA